MRHQVAVIVGAGPAGASAAIALAQEGERALMLERAQETEDAICGGFLSWRTVARLQALGVDVDALGAAPVERLELFAGGRRSTTGLVAPARALSRRALDEALVARALAVGAELRRGVHVRLHEDGSLGAGEGEDAGPDEPLILATGKHELRGVRRTIADDDLALGVRWRFLPTPSVADLLRGAIELHLFPGGYAGLVMQEDGTANLCAAVRRSAFTEAGRSPAAMLSTLTDQYHQLAERMNGAELVASDTIANVPYGWIARSTDRFYRVGDQAAVIPSLAGEGIGIAIASGMLAGEAAARGEPPASFQPRLGRALAGPVSRAGLIWKVGESRSGRLLPPLVRTFPGLAIWAMNCTRFDGLPRPLLPIEHCARSPYGAADDPRSMDPAGRRL